MARAARHKGGIVMKRANEAKLRELLTQHLPEAQRTLLREKEACLEACAYIYTCDSFNDAFKYVENVNYLPWLMASLGLCFGWEKTPADASLAASIRRQQPWDEVHAAMARWLRAHKAYQRNAKARTRSQRSR